ncbi:MAG: 5-(carboxyamino)imidazole ribonucleotide synthase [Planctomyces sp.]|nr:5-(carboxyamino)imidazole ribonucleotide synthase [Planctomyces sp.]
MKPILPGATLGVLGSGQLGRMFAIAARRLGYRIEVYSPDSQTPAGQVCDREWAAAYDDLDQLRAFAAGVDVVTLEFENVSADAVNTIERTTPVRPGPGVLETAQHRSREKSALRRMGIPTAPFAIVRSAREVEDALPGPEFQGEGILKTSAWGYDGKGQRRLASGDDLSAAWQSLGDQECVLEGIIDFECEASAIGVRGLDGEFRTFGPFLNEHRNHILDVTIAPAEQLSDRTRREALDITRTIMDSLNVVGVLCVEFFVERGGRLLVNELAPRPHNSGHLTIDAHRCCQFEQQVRSVCGLPLGSVEQLQPAAMANLLGDVWDAPGGPDWQSLLALPDVKLHLYGKDEPRAGRKMGHLTALAETPSAAEALARQARETLCAGRRIR